MANTLTFLGYQPVWQDIFGTESGDLSGKLRQQIEQCKGVVQLVGNCYGAEPPAPDEEFGRVSYTQYEALYAKKRGKKVWYLLIDASFPVDKHESELPEMVELQDAYRRGIKADADLFHSLASRDALESSVLKLRNQLRPLRRGAQRWAVAVLILLILIAVGGVWQVRSARQTRQTQEVVLTKQEDTIRQLADMRQIILRLPQKEIQLRQNEDKENPDAARRRAVDELARQFGLDPQVVEKELPRFARQLKQSPAASSFERANAAYVAKEFPEAERLALIAADDARKAVPPKTGEAIMAFELAGLAAQKRIEYADALSRLRRAEALTGRTRDPLEWARVQYAIAQVLLHQGHYQEAENILREVLREHARALPQEHLDTLTTRNCLANALASQGKLVEAEAELRAVFKLQEKLLGAENWATLGTRSDLAAVLALAGKYSRAENELLALLELRAKKLGSDHIETLETRANLANVFSFQKKYVEAEDVLRTVLKLREKALGFENPKTLTTRADLANVLAFERKYPEAETELRAVLEIREKVLGPEHPDTLATRTDRANVLSWEGKDDEAEIELRVVLKFEERVLGVQHPDTLRVCFNLANCSRRLGKTGDAKRFAQRAAEGILKTLGPDHPTTQKYIRLWHDLRSETDQ